MNWLSQLIDITAEAVVKWLGSRAAFVQITLTSILWVPILVFTGVDKNGFFYLYLATALSLITQVPLAMLGRRAVRKAEAAEARTTDTLTALLTMMKAMQALMESVRHEMAEQDEILEEIHHEVHTPENLTRDDIATTSSENDQND